MFVFLRCVVPVVLVQNKEFCVLHVQSNNYILLSSTVRIQLHVSARARAETCSYVGHLQASFKYNILSSHSIFSNDTNYNILLA